MLVAGVRAELRITGARSLKEKRHVVKSLVSALASGDGVAVAEIDHQDLWQRCTLGIAVVASSPSRLEQLISGAQRVLHNREGSELLAVDIHYLEDER
ncbi:MAG: DUF503 domain-containing protein [Acidobacteria bacterium]|nr:DUF503 domain-containing protein [Acidobacteriota bacterium]